MSGDYRDDLGAAHARIAELEEKVGALEAALVEAKRPPRQGEFPELEAAVEKDRRAADPDMFQRLNVAFIVLSFVLPMAGAAFSFSHLPIFAIACSAIFISTVLARVLVTRAYKRATASLASSERKLEEARRAADAAAARVRIAAAQRVVAGPAVPADDDVAEAEHASARRAR